LASLSFDRSPKRTHHHYSEWIERSMIQYPSTCYPDPNHDGNQMKCFLFVCKNIQQSINCHD
jgi:hypothetical protein